VLPSLTGCGDEPREISEVRRVAAEPTARVNSATRFGLESEEARGHAGHAHTPYTWQVPPGWQALPPTPMRAASFAIASAPEIDCSLTLLPSGGGGLAANLNRWRRQMSLGELSSDELRALPTLPVLGTQAALLECDGTYTGMGTGPAQPGAKLLGVALEHGGGAIFVKMVGPAAAVGRERKNFETFCRSLRAAPDGPSTAGPSAEMPVAKAPAATAPIAPPPVASAPPAASPAASAPQAWTAPPTWKRVQASSMRLVSFAVGSAGATECYVTVLEGGGGGLAANINRWRQQMAQPELTAAEIAALPAIPMLGTQGRLVRIQGHFTGMDGASRSDAMMLGAVCELPSQSVFVKMVGPAAEVAAEEARFAAFCRSLR
jgi:hypothetical protein